MSWVLEASMAKVISPKPNSAVVTQRSRAPICDGVLVGSSMAMVIPDFSLCASEKCRLVGPLALHQLCIDQSSPAPSALDIGRSNTMDFGITIATAADSWKVVKRAEELGFTYAWFYDTQMLNADPFVAMAAAAA